MLRRPIAYLLLSLLIAFLAGADWPQWRGPLGTGLAPDPVGAPIEWSGEKNVRWKTPLPGPGNSTPIVLGQRVLLTGAEEGGKLRSLYCFDRKTGKELWRKDTRYAVPELTHPTNPACASSPVTDGERVFVWHGSAGFFAYDLNGNEVWSKDLGKFEHVWGFASSPIIADDLVILSAGPGLRAFVVAMNPGTGEEAWRFEPKESVSGKVDEFRGSWSTPVLAEIDGRQQLLISLPQRLYSLDPHSGQVIWSCGGLGDLVYTSPLPGDGVVVAMSGYHGPCLAVKTAEASGDVTETHRLWRLDQKPDNPQRVGSGVIVGDYVYIYNEPGIMFCIEARTGKLAWQERLGGTGWCSACFRATIKGRPLASQLRRQTISFSGVWPANCAELPESVIQAKWCRRRCSGVKDIFDDRLSGLASTALVAKLHSKVLGDVAADEVLQSVRELIRPHFIDTPHLVEILAARSKHGDLGREGLEFFQRHFRHPRNGLQLHHGSLTPWNGDYAVGAHAETDETASD
jgi:outer membrane protein assembly factor BamB